MIRFQNRAFALLAAGLLALPGAVLAFGNGTPDGQPPAEEVICDPNVGLRGAAYGLCVAYCEANDCDLDPEQHACEVLLHNFHRITGRTDVPCVVISNDTPR
ncbi:MAG: hypothetical protein ABIR79_16815 [Candidatus Binatia bacterium]